MKVFQRVFFAGCALFLAACGRHLSDVSSSFSYHTTSLANAEGFESAFNSFLKDNGFVPVLSPNTLLSSAGGHGNGAADVWLKGSYRGSRPFFLRYYTERAANSVSIHAFTMWDIHGSDSDRQKMEEVVRGFSNKLQHLALEYK